MANIELDVPVKADLGKDFGVQTGVDPSLNRPVLTPAEIIAAENARATGENGQQAQPEGTEKKEEAPVVPVKIGNVDLDELQKKLDSKTPLSAEELEAVRQINNPAPPPPEKTYKIAGQDFKRSEMLEKARDHFKSYVDPDLALAPDAEDKLIEDFYKLQNRTVQQITVQKTSEQNARDRREIDARAQAVRIEEARLDARKEMLRNDAERIQREKERLTADANLNIKEEDIQNEAQRMMYQKKILASESLQRLSEDEQALRKQQSEVNTQSFRAMISGFQVAQPIYSLPEPLDNMIAKYQAGTISDHDKIVLLELDQLAKEAVTGQKAIEDLYLLKSQQGVLAVPKLPRTAQPSGQGSETQNTVVPDLNNQPQTLAEKVRKHIETVRKNPDLIGGGGTGGDSRNSVVPTAKDIVRAGQKAMGEDRASDKATLKGLGLDY